MKKRWLFLILPVITLLLELLPYGAVCNFGNPNGEPWRVTYSYFDMLPFGYANFAPFITALATCLILILLVIYCITGNIGLAMTTRTLLWVITAISLAPLLYGIHFFSIVGLLITILLAAEALLLHFVFKRN